MKNVVLITVDCLRADHMGCYGYHRKTTPFIDSIAERSLFFENAFANGPNTRHSVPSFLTSTYPLLFLDEAKAGRFHEGRKSMAELLKEHGYSTAAIHSNPYISKFYGYDRGFDYFNDFLLGQVEDEIERSKISKILHEAAKGIKAVFMHKLPHEDGERINEEAIKWLENANEPFFLWLHYMDVHMPYVPPNRFLEELGLRKYSHIRKIWMGKKIDDVEMREKIRDEEVPDYINLYDGCIRYTDWVLQSLIRKIEKNFPETLFVITADHGEEFREHGGLGHEEKLYDELLHIPLIFYGKDVESSRMEKPVSLLNIVPTIFHFLGLQRNEWMQGKNVFEVTEEYIIAEAWKGERITAYRDSEWKLIISGDKKELYNLRDDPKEQQNLYEREEHKEKCREFEKIINNHVEMLEEERKRRMTWLQKEKIRKAMRRMRG
ncbi:MAG: sulfatase [Thermoplasmata archaeon]|nr:sulfatase [Thermoplasmata archaeon]